MIEGAAKNPLAVLTVLILAMLAGVWASLSLPVQLVPDVQQGRVSLITRWAGAPPADLEANILEPQEDALQGLRGLIRMEASATPGIAVLNLTLEVDSDMQAALADIANRLNAVPAYPAEVDEPRVIVGPTTNETAIAWLSIRPKTGDGSSIVEHQTLIERVVRPAIMRLDGIASTQVVGGQQREIRVTFDPDLLVERRLDLRRLIARLRGVEDASGGYFEEGRRQYALRLVGGQDPESIRELIVSDEAEAVTRLGDVAKVAYGLADPPGVFSENGGQSIAISVQAERGVNVLTVMQSLKDLTAAMNGAALGAAGLEMTLVYDDSIYVRNAIIGVLFSLATGIFLAVVLLWVFYRDLRLTALVAVTIPLALIAAIAVFAVLGRSLNVISLAGLAFALGGLDSIIVVLDSTYRRVQAGEPRLAAAVSGARQVRTALIASVATNVLVFAPVLLLRSVPGQLFADLALSVVVTSVITFLLALLFIPAIAGRIRLAGSLSDDKRAHLWSKLAARVTASTDDPRARMIAVICGVSLPLICALVLLPPRDYLPDGRQNQIYASISPPPGLSLTTARREITDVIDQRMKPYLSGAEQPAVSNYWLGFFGSGGFIGATVEDPRELDALLKVLNEKILTGFPDVKAYASRVSIFQRFGSARVIDLNVQGAELQVLLAAARQGEALIAKALPGSQVRAVPGLELSEPEFRMRPDHFGLREAGLTRDELSDVVRAFGDGLWLGEFFDQDDRLALVLRAAPWHSTDELLGSPLFTERAGAVPLRSLVSAERTAGPSQIRRVDGQRTITLRITPPEGVSLQEALAALDRLVVPTVNSLVVPAGSVTLQGVAEDMDVALKALTLNLILAVVVLAFILLVLTRSAADTAILLATLPITAAGGVVMLTLVNLVVFQPLDLLTIIGFVALMGIAINNPILLLEQARACEKEGMTRRDAIGRALELRMKAILATTGTTAIGIAPMLLIPGPGSELYRGLAAVITGGLLSNVAFTIIFVPMAFRLGEREARTVVKSAENS